MAERTHYEVLGVTVDADAAVVDAAYAAMIRRSPSGPTREKIDAAHAAIGNSVSRTRYDADLDARSPVPPRPAARATTRSGATPPQTSPTGKPSSGNGPWLWGAGGVIALMFWLGSLDREPAPTFTPTAAAPTAESALSPAALAPPPPQAATIVTATRHAGMALGADGLAGALVYSRACHASVERAFDLARLDRCGGFDAQVASATLGELDYDPAASEWFAPTAAQVRYAAAAAASGLDVESVRARWAAIGALALERPVTPIIARAPKAAIVERDADLEDSLEGSSLTDFNSVLDPPSTPTDTTEPTPAQQREMTSGNAPAD